MTTRRWLVAVGALVTLLLAASVIALFFVDEPLRRYTEARMNASLEGYTARVGRMHFNPINFSMDVRDIVIAQNEHPDPPVASIERIHASVHWRALLAGRVVGDALIDHPVVVLNLTQARTEIADSTPLKDKGWQHALQSRSTSSASAGVRSPTGTRARSSRSGSTTWRSPPPTSATSTPSAASTPPP
jgi:uncharacterized protein involved in outer membrane biogenesis